MRITLGNHQWFDGEGKPLVAGRVSVYLHDSDVKADIYSLEGDDYVQMENPVTLDDLGSCDSIWFDAGLVDVRVERYNGIPGSYSLLNTYSDGFVLPDVTNDTVVYGISALAAANPALGSVTVQGYLGEHDCGQRTFVWDPDCTLNEDGGAIVASTTSENGRWLLLSDERYMPCSWYGVRAGYAEANVSAFLTYPEFVGHWNIRLPPVPRFSRGVYTSTGTFSTPRTVAFDTGARFSKASFVCNAAEVMHCTNYVADFRFALGNTVRAESCWFRTVSGFWGCNAAEFHQSSVNYFADTQLSSMQGIANARISGKPVTMTGTGGLVLGSCDVAPGSLSTDWYTEFHGMAFSDIWFTGTAWDFGTWPSHHIRVNPAYNTVSVSNFSDPNVYVLLMAANGATSIDLGGREISTVSSSMPFTEISRAVISEARFSHSVTLRGCRVSYLHFENSSLSASLLDGCEANIYNCNMASLTVKDSLAVLDDTLDTYATSFLAMDSEIYLSAGDITRKDPTNHLTAASTRIERCTVSGGTVANNAMVLADTTFLNTRVAIFPQSSILGGRVERCTFEGSSVLRLVPGAADGSSPDIHDVTVHQLQIRGNTFNTSSAGIEMPFWAEDMQHRFIAGACTSVDVTGRTASWAYHWDYSGNTGNCPGSCGEKVEAFTYPVHQVSFGSGSNDRIDFAGGSVCSVFALPVTYSDGGSEVNGAWVISDRAKCTTPYRARAVCSTGGTFQGAASFPMTMYTPLCAWDRTLPNTMFSCLVGGSQALAMFGALPLPAGR